MKNIYFMQKNNLLIKIFLQIIMITLCFITIFLSSKAYSETTKSQTNTSTIQNTTQFIDLDLQNINIQTLLKMFADFTHKNIVVSDKIVGKTNIKLTHITWQDALTSILNTQNLTKSENANVIFIAPKEDIEKYKQSNELNNTASIIKLSNTSANNIADILSKQTQFIDAKNLGVDYENNRLIIKAPTEQIENIAKLSHSLDLPTKQVMLEGWIINADDKVTTELGLKFATSQEQNSTNSTANNGNNNNNNSNNGITTDLPFSINQTGQFAYSLAKLGNNTILNMELSALENAGHIKVLSNPKLITANNQPAYIESGEEIPYQEKTSRGATNTAFKKAVLSLKATPIIISENKIILNLQLNQDKVSDMSVNGIPAIQTQQMQTQVSINNGETVVLGGIYEYSTIENTSKIPFLSAIPILGHAFKHKYYETTRRELLIFITPKIVLSE